MVALERVPEEEIETLHEQFLTLPAWRRKSFEAFVALQRNQLERAITLRNPGGPRAVHPPMETR